MSESFGFLGTLYLSCVKSNGKLYPSTPNLLYLDPFKETPLSFLSLSADVALERWPFGHPRFDELRTVIHAEQQTRFLTFKAAWHRSSHILVALHEISIVGFLRFVVQEIGPDNEQASVLLNDVALTEAKVVAFGVIAEARNQGIGRGLQQAALEWAYELGCYQVRSHSAGKSRANHHLKLSMGFAVHPIIRGDDVGGAYFIMPLHPLFGSSANK